MQRLTSFILLLLSMATARGQFAINGVRPAYDSLTNTYLVPLNDALFGKSFEAAELWNDFAAKPYYANQEPEARSAVAREEQRWSGDSDLGGHQLDFADELDYLKTWTARHLEYLDRQWLDGLGTVHIHQSPSETIPLYDLQGRCIRYSDRPSMARGIYVREGKSFVVAE